LVIDIVSYLDQDQCNQWWPVVHGLFLWCRKTDFQTTFDLAHGLVQGQAFDRDRYEDAVAGVVEDQEAIVEAVLDEALYSVWWPLVGSYQGVWRSSLVSETWADVVGGVGSVHGAKERSSERLLVSLFLPPPDSQHKHVSVSRR
jgi:hypothetical protein